MLAMRITSVIYHPGPSGVFTKFLVFPLGYSDGITIYAQAEFHKYGGPDDLFSLVAHVLQFEIYFFIFLLQCVCA